MKLVKSLWDYFNLNKSDKRLGLAPLPSPPITPLKPVQKKKEKKPFPYYRFVNEWDDASDYQCLACKNMFSLGFNPTTLKFCPTCGIEFEGEWTKVNPRYNQYNTKYPYFKHPIIKLYIKAYHRKDIIKDDLDSFSLKKNTPVTQELLNITKDNPKYYKWEDVCTDYILPFCSHASSKIKLREQKNRIKYYTKTSKVVQLWVSVGDKHKMLFDVKGLDEPYEVGYGKITGSGCTYYSIGVSG